MKFFKRELTVFNMSALDLFASAMGAFIIVAVLLFPFYMNVSEAQSRVQEAAEKLEEAQAAHAAAAAEAEEARILREAAEAAAAAAREALDRAQAKRNAAAAETAQVASAIDGCEARKSALEIGDMDLVFVIDTTISMEGDIRALSAEMAGIVRVLEKVVNDLRIGVVAYRDIDMNDPASYITDSSPLLRIDEAGLTRTVQYIRDLSTAGGETCAEAVEKGIETAVTLPWREDARRQIVVVGDAQAHPENWPRAFSLAAAFAGSVAPSRIAAVYREHPTPYCPSNLDDTRFFRELALKGSGEFVDKAGTISESVLMTVLKSW